ncbi:MAG: amidohydrolase family protein, partial [Candidatus Nanopelagicales bacterium]
RDFVQRRIHGSSDLIGFQLAFDVTGDPEFPEKAAFEAARELGVNVTTHAGVWAITKDESINLMYENGFMTPGQIYVHSTTLSPESYQKIAATGGFASVSTESESSAGQGYPPTWQLRKYGVPVSLSMDTSVWWSADLFSAMRSTVNADRVRVHMDFHERGETVVNHPLRAETAVEWATIGGAKALGIADKVGSLEVGKQADIVLIKNDRSPAMFPILNPYGHVVYQATRGDVHSVLVDGKVLKHDGELIGAADKVGKAREVVGQTVDHLMQALGDEKWVNGMNPELAPDELFDNPYQYSDHEIGQADAHQE